MAYRQRPRSAAAGRRSSSAGRRSSRSGSYGGLRQHGGATSGGWQERFRQLKIHSQATGLRATGYGYSHHRAASNASPSGRPTRPDSAQARMHRAPARSSSHHRVGSYAHRGSSGYGQVPRANVGNYIRPSSASRNGSSGQRPTSASRSRSGSRPSSASRHGPGAQPTMQRRTSSYAQRKRASISAAREAATPATKRSADNGGQTLVGDLIAQPTGRVQTGNPALHRRAREGHPVKAFAANPAATHASYGMRGAPTHATAAAALHPDSPSAAALAAAKANLAAREAAAKAAAEAAVQASTGAHEDRPSECNPNAPMSKASTRASQMSAEFDASHEVATDASKATPGQPSVVTASGATGAKAVIASVTPLAATSPRTTWAEPATGLSPTDAKATAAAPPIASAGAAGAPTSARRASHSRPASASGAAGGAAGSAANHTSPRSKASGRPQSAHPSSTRGRYRPQSASRNSRFTPAAERPPVAGGGTAGVVYQGTDGARVAYGGRTRPQSAGGARSSSSSSRPRSAATARQYSRYQRQQAESAAQVASATTSVNLVVTDGKTGVNNAELQRIEYEHRQRLQKYVSHKAYDGRSSTEFYKFGKVLGQGSFGKVRLAWHKLTGARVAVKSYEKERLKEPSHWRRTQQEIRLMERMNHPNIIRMLETLESPKRIHIVMEHAGGGNLCQYVKARKRLGEADARAIFVQILLAVEYLHTTGIVHRDIKLENVLFDENRSMKLVDFGFSVGCRDPTKKLKIFCGTPSYMAPEIVMRRQYEGRPVDIWSLGVLLYAMLCGMFPFVAKSYPELYKKIVRAHLRLPDFMSHAVKDLLRRMLHPDATKRLTVAQIKRHCWCSTPVQALTRQLRHAAEHSILVSDCSEDDLYMAVVLKCGELGFNVDLVAKSILGRARNHFSVTYYLLLFMYGRTKAAKRTQQYYMEHMPRVGDKIYCGPYSAALRRKLLFEDASLSPSPGRTAERKSVRPSSAAAVRPSARSSAQRPASASTKRTTRPTSAQRSRRPDPRAAASTSTTSALSRSQRSSDGHAGSAPPTQGGKEKEGLLDMMRYQNKPGADADKPNSATAGSGAEGGPGGGGGASESAVGSAADGAPNFDGVLDLMDGGSSSRGGSTSAASSAR